MNHDRDSASDALRAALANRDELHQALVDLEQAVAAAGPSRASDWAQSVATCLRGVDSTFRQHVHVTEARDGLYEEILTLAPRLGHAVDRLREEHEVIGSQITALLAEVAGGPQSDPGDWIDARREQCLVVLGGLTRHRQRGADLTYEAYTDVGGDG
jgi:hypothetical protein